MNINKNKNNYKEKTIKKLIKQRNSGKKKKLTVLT